MRRKNPPLELEARRVIYQLILKSPGLHFRELQRRTGSVTGALQYHLDYLKKNKLVSEEKDRDYSRFYVVGKLNPEEKGMISFLRQESVRRILIQLLEHPRSNHKKLKDSLGISASTLSWHLKRLSEAGLLETRNKTRETTFRVANQDLIVKLFIRYRKSFLDRLVDEFINSWER